LPGPGVWLKRGEAMGWIQRGHLALPLPAPISGEVLEVNHALVAVCSVYGQTGEPRNKRFVQHTENARGFCPCI
ncbi:MAG: hypothetical protein R6U40_13205, partial [Desulfobacterales bacterium]